MSGWNMHGTQNGEETVFKGVRIRKDQASWLDARVVNFSELVRRLIDAYIAEEDAGRRDDETDQKAIAAVSA